MTRPHPRNGLGAKALLSVDEAAILLEITRSTAYKAISDGTFPVQVIRVGGRLRIPRASIRRLLDGTDCITDAASSSAPRDLANPITPVQSLSGTETCPTCGCLLSSTLPTPISNRAPIWSAARLSSSGTASV